MARNDHKSRIARLEKAQARYDPERALVIIYDPELGPDQAFEEVLRQGRRPKSLVFLPHNGREPLNEGQGRSYRIH